jgi:superfamily II DNA helicase RecQ
MSDPGMTLVIMPLLSLIEDNMNYVQSIGIEACELRANSDQTLIDEIKSLKYKIVYSTPESIISYHEDLLEPMYVEDKISRFVIDEIHCVKTWGTDFRFDYLRLMKFKQNYPTVPILGLTATASKKVIIDVEELLGLPNGQFLIYKSSFI